MSRRSARRPAHRPRLLDADTHEKIVSATESGSPMWAAAAYAGVSERAFQRWLKRGYEEEVRVTDDEEEPNPEEAEFRDLYVAITEARAKATVQHVALVKRAAVGGVIVEETTKTYTDRNGDKVEEKTVRRSPPDWRASSWWLERRDAGNFGKPDQIAVELSGPGGGPVHVETTDATALAERVRDNILQLTAATAAATELTGDDVVDGELVEDD